MPQPAHSGRQVALFVQNATIFPGFFYFLKEILLETMLIMLYNNRVYAAVGGISDLSREEMIT